MILIGPGSLDSGKPKLRKRVDWARIGRLFAPYWRQNTLLLACIAIAAGLGTLPPLLTKFIIDGALPSRDLHALYIDVAAMILAAVGMAAIGVYQGYLNAVIGHGIMRDLRTSLVAHLHTMPLSFFTATKTGEIMNRVSGDVDNVNAVVTNTLMMIVTQVFVIVTTLVTLFILDWRLAVLSLIVLPLMIIPTRRAGSRMYVSHRASREKRDELESITQETLSLSGITLVKAFVRERYERERFYSTGTDLMRIEIGLDMTGRGFMAAISAMDLIGPALIWLAGGWFVIERGGLTVGTVVAAIAYLMRLYRPVSALAGTQTQIISALAVFERIFDYLDMSPEPSNRESGIVLAKPRGRVSFEHVSFSYAQGRAALADVTFDVAPGETAAFVGPSGAGKTTITALLPRFYDPQSGTVRVDGMDLRELNLESLRHHIGIVTQETYLFHDTIANNLRYGRPDADESDLVAAAKAANIHDFIASLPEGYATVVGERGHKLSGGERQRLAIARVLLKNPRILILDEATSSLDSVNESLIQDALVPLLRGRTSLVIAHRLSTILSADVIFVVDHGRIVERGTHAHLLSLGGTYAGLYREQFGNGRQPGPVAADA